MEYSNTPYVGMGLKKIAAALNVYKWYVQKSTLHVVSQYELTTLHVVSLYEPYLLFSSVFITNKTLSDAGEHH